MDALFKPFTCMAFTLITADNNMKKLTPLLIAASISLGIHTADASNAAQPFAIEVDKPTFVLPQFSGPYTEKEANIAPEELETAERLRGLLESGDKQAVLKELEAFYDIELSVAMLMLKAQLYFALEDYAKAEKTYLASLARSPQLIRAHSDLGQLYLIQNNPKKAREYFAKAISLGAKDAVIYGQLAYLNLTLHGPYSAINAYQQALAIEPEQQQWQQGLFVALTQAKMYQAAQALLTDLIAKQPNDSKLWLNQAILKLEQNDSRGALVSLEMAILLGDKRESNLKTAAQLHLQQDSFERAVELINTHLSNYTLDLASLNTYLTWLSQRDLWPQSEKILTSLDSKLTTFDAKTKSVIYLHKAMLNRQLAKPTLAKQNFKLALDNNASAGQALLEYADFLVSQKSFTAAETLFLRAEALETWQRQAMLARAQMYVDIQNYAAALTVLRSVEIRFPATQGLAEQITLLQNIIVTKKQQAEI